MATYTVLVNSELQNRSDLVIEYAVLAGSNAAGVAWQTVVAELRAVEQTSPDAQPTSNPRKTTDAAYIASLDAGSVLEIPLSVEYDANLSNGAKVAVLDAAATDKVSAFIAAFSSLYEFYGTVRTI